MVSRIWPKSLLLQWARTSVFGWVLLALLLLPGSASAWKDLHENANYFRGMADGIHVTDGSYVMNAGELQIHLTNWGLIGSNYSATCPWCDAPSAQWPAGSGHEYLWSAGLWVGAVMLGQRRVSTGQFETEFRPRDELEDTIYEGVAGYIRRPLGYEGSRGSRVPSPDADDDEDGLVDEEILNGYDDDEDELIDEDYGQIGNQMMVCTMYDNTRLSQEIWPDHQPLNLEIVMKAYAWEGSNVHDFIGFEFSVKNIGVTELKGVYVGFFADCDIGQRGQDGVADDDMAGVYAGMVRATDGSFVPVTVGYMYDAAESNALPGYFGILFLGQAGNSLGRIRSYQNFATETPYEDGGDPTNDVERYELLSLEEWDSPSNRENDFRFLISAGPVAEVQPQSTLNFQAAMVAGTGLGGLLRTCAEAYQTWFGSYFDLDNNPETGRGGREAITCVEWWGIDPQTRESELYQRVADYMDPTCLSPDVPSPNIEEGDLEPFGPALNCLWVNFDNCDECDRLAPSRCFSTNNNFLDYWNCNDYTLPEQARGGCTGVGGREGQVNWIVGLAPPPPGMRVWPTDNSAHVYWNNESEITKDIRLNTVDFESYRLWRADNWSRPFGSSAENGPSSDLWQLIAEFDLINNFYTNRFVGHGQYQRDSLPLGANTGLEVVRYTPSCLADPQFTDLIATMQEVVLADSFNNYVGRPELRDQFGSAVPGLEDLLTWEGYPDVIDTVFWTTERLEDEATGVVGKEAVRFYEYIDHDVHNGFIYFYSVTATDHELDFTSGGPLPAGSGLVGDPSANYTDVIPGAKAQTAAEREQLGVNIFTFPNPATRESLEEFQQLFPNSNDPTGLRIMFTNLPAARNTIEIFTLDGDLVKVLNHDGTDGYGQIAWNLVSRNGQQVVSGIYLYNVHSDDSRFDDFIGKFVVIR
ncbi:MAG: hypothetical protein ABIF77_22205 [bacterium]